MPVRIVRKPLLFHPNHFPSLPHLLPTAAAFRDMLERGRCDINALESSSQTHAPHEAVRLATEAGEIESQLEFVENISINLP
jgi:hypothetical protein